jgi:hypothetical protein
MSSAVERPHHSGKEPILPEIDPLRADLVLQELDRILTSRFFKNAVRSRQFLEYVVQNRLAGRPELLKERTIGTEVFHRDPGYATGDDPVVRVQAGEVRRRLEQYYQATQDRSSVRIDLPVGSYAPRIHWLDEESRHVESVDARPMPPRVPPPPLGTGKPARRWQVITLCLAVALIAGLAFEMSHVKMHPKSIADEFWAPTFATPQPVLICVAKPMVYRPTLGLYQRYARNHPGTFEHEVERSNQLLPLAGNEKLTWSEMLPYPDYGVAVGDAYSAVRVSGLLGQMGKPSQVRIGTNYSFEDLRNSPDVIIGAFNNKWTMQIAPSLHFALVEENGEYMIREQIPNGRVWRADLRESERFGDDFAVVARLLDSKTGQFTVIAAGLTSSGTQSAGEFISNPDFLEKGLRNLPAEWQRKNLELVLQTTVTDSTAGPPQLLAVYSW